MKDEREKFSQRLSAAMKKCGYQPRPGVLLKVFNSQYSGISVTAQTTSRWLGGKAIPEQDKLQVLAGIFGVEPHALRYGSVGKERLSEQDRQVMGASERQTINAFLALSPKRRELVGELVTALGQDAVDR
jgi:transcriptional regulator with XRE-family HTH domain